MEYSNNRVTSRVHQGGRNRPGPKSIALLWGMLLLEMCDFSPNLAKIFDFPIGRIPGRGNSQIGKYSNSATTLTILPQPPI
jgi:hypothetical protein